MTFYVISGLLVFFFSGLLAMAGLGAAFLFVPMFYYMGVPLSEAVPAALFLNVVSMVFATVNYWRGKLINFRVALPILVVAVVMAPVGARLSPHFDKTVLLSLFIAFLVFAGAMMLFYRRPTAEKERTRKQEVGYGVGVGGVAGFLGGLLGIGGGNFIVPVLNWLGLDPKVAAATTGFVVVFSSLSGFLGHATLGGLDPVFVGVTGVMAAAGSIAGSQLMRKGLSSSQLKRLIGVLLWLIALKMAWDLFG